MKTLLCTSLSLLCVGSLVAQTNQAIGFTSGWTTTYTTRIGANLIEADLLTHFDSRDYSDWMLDPLDPLGATQTFKAFTFVIQDQIGSTPENYTISAYNEDALNPNFPDAATPWFRTAPIAMPASTVTTPVAWIITVTLPTTLVAAPKGDHWLGIGLFPATGTNWPTDGASVHAAYDRASGSTSTATSDQCGLGISGRPNNGEYSCYMPTPLQVPAGPAVYGAGAAGTRKQIRMEIVCDQPGGVCVTQTNQTTYASSNPVATTTMPLGGTSNFFSGLHPDIYNGTNSATPRNDDIGFRIADNSTPFMPAFLMVAFAPSLVGSMPITTLFPPLAGSGSKGNICIEFASAAVMFGVTDANGVFQQSLSLSPGGRSIIQGLSLPGQPFDLWYQGFTLNLANPNGLTEVHATGCGVQHL